MDPHAIVHVWHITSWLVQARTGLDTPAINMPSSMTVIAPYLICDAKPLLTQVFCSPSLSIILTDVISLQEDRGDEAEAQEAMKCFKPWDTSSYIINKQKQQKTMLCIIVKSVSILPLSNALYYDTRERRAGMQV